MQVTITLPDDLFIDADGIAIKVDQFDAADYLQDFVWQIMPTPAGLRGFVQATIRVWAKLSDAEQDEALDKASRALIGGALHLFGAAADRWGDDGANDCVDIDDLTSCAPYALTDDQMFDLRGKRYYRDDEWQRARMPGRAILDLEQTLAEREERRAAERLIAQGRAQAAREAEAARDRARVIADAQKLGLVVSEVRAPRAETGGRDERVG